MTMDIATLGIRITSDGIDQARSSLDGLTKTGASAEASIKRFNESAKQTGKSIPAEHMRKLKDELAQLVGQIDPAVAALNRLDEQEQKLARFRKLGLVDTETFTAMNARIAQTRAEMARYSDTAGKAAMSAKQLAFANRQLPMQFTDIAVGLATGQRPMMVLLQQGGQLKDMFGGVGQAARALGSYIIGLVNPFTVAAAAAIALGAAFSAAAKRSDELNKAVISTGHSAGISAQDLDRLAGSLDSIAGVTKGKAVEAIAQVTAAGVFTGSQIEQVSTAALQAQQSLGIEIEKTIGMFSKLQDRPLEGALELNKTMNFLTESLVNQIAKLEEQGKKAEASKVAMTALADAIASRSGEMEGNLSAIASGFGAIKNAASEALDGVVNFANGAANAMADALNNSRFADWNRKMLGATKYMGGSAALVGTFASGMLDSAEARAKSVQERIAQGVAQSFALTDRVGAQAAAERLESEKKLGESAKALVLQYDKQKALQNELVELESKRKFMSAEEFKIVEQGIREKYADKKPSGAGRARIDRSAEIAQRAEAQFFDIYERTRAELEGPLARAELDHAMRLERLNELAATGKVSREDLKKAIDAETAAYERSRQEIQSRIDAEVAALVGPVAQAQNQHEQALRRIEELRDQMTDGQYETALRREAEIYRDQARAARDREEPIRAILDAMTEELQLIGLTNAERTIANELIRQGIDLKSQEAQVELEHARNIEATGERMRQQIDLMDEWRQGSANALADFVTGAKSAKDALKDFFDDMARMITQMIAERWMQQLFGSFGTSQTGSQGAGIFSMIGNLFGKGFASGGYTGAGGVNQPAGIVHRGEVVWSQADVRRAGGVATVEAMRKGGGGNVNNVTQTFVVQGTPDRMTRQQLASKMGAETARAMRRA